jgi:Hemerythrin HHE cation binding domain
MNAIDMLEQQHREIAALFDQLAEAQSYSSRRKAFERVADALVVHATLEERHFYPAVRRRATEQTLLESLEEHLAMKRVIADLLALRPDDDVFAAKVKVLRDEVDHHVREEQQGLFPAVRKLFDVAMLVAIGEAISATRAQLVAAGHPRDAVTAETAHAASL